jgi:hypothetical protein
MRVIHSRMRTKVVNGTHCILQQPLRAGCTMLFCTRLQRPRGVAGPSQLSATNGPGPLPRTCFRFVRSTGCLSMSMQPVTVTLDLVTKLPEASTGPCSSHDEQLRLHLRSCQTSVAGQLATRVGLSQASCRLLLHPPAAAAARPLLQCSQKGVALH